MDEVMTDADFEKALDALREEDPTGEVGELLKMMSENRMISWEEAEQILGGSTYSAPIKSSLPVQTRPTEPDNETDVDHSIQLLQQNDPKLKQINLNNMKRTPIPQVKRLISAIRDNTMLEKLALANMGLYDNDVEPIFDVIENNTTLKAVNFETNYLSGEFFSRLFQVALKNQTLEEVKAVNQGVTFATCAEKQIIEAVNENRGLIKVSINLRLPEGRHKIENAMLRNGEIKRILRREAAAEAAAAAAAASASVAVAKKPQKTEVANGVSTPKSVKSAVSKASKPGIAGAQPNSVAKVAPENGTAVPPKLKPKTDNPETAAKKTVKKVSTKTTAENVEQNGAEKSLPKKKIMKKKVTKSDGTNGNSSAKESINKGELPTNGVKGTENGVNGAPTSVKKVVPKVPPKKTAVDLPMQVYPLKRPSK